MMKVKRRLAVLGPGCGTGSLMLNVKGREGERLKSGRLVLSDDMVLTNGSGRHQF